MDDVLRFYPCISRDETRFHLFEAGPRILPEIDETLAAVASRVLQRRGADVRVATPVRSIEGGRVHVANETIHACTIVLVAGIVPSAIASAIPVVPDQRGRIAVDETMRSRSDPRVWALGDCAAKKLFVYGMGRTITPSEAYLDQVVTKWKAGPGTLGDLVKELVVSDVFRFRKGAAQ